MLLAYIYHSTTSRVSYRVWPMYTSDIEKRNVGARTSANWRRQIADIDFVKYSKQRAMTLKSDPSAAAVDNHPRRRAPWRSLMWVVVGSRHGVVMNFKGHRDNQLLDATVVTQQMTVIEIIIADLHCLSNSGRHVGLCVFVNAVCAGEQCTCETCIRA